MALFRRPSTNQLPLELVESLLSFDSSNVHIIKMQQSGKNALDFYLSFYLGKISEIDPQADVCILARDSGYDVLVEHLNTFYDGIDIIRLPDTNQVSLIDNMTEKNCIGAFDIQPITADKTCVTNKIVNEEDESSITSMSNNRQDVKFDVTNTFIQHCYALVYKELTKPNAFLPSCQHNLFSDLQKYVLTDELQSYDAATKLYVVQQVFAKLQKYGLLKVDARTNKLSYHVDVESILHLIKNFVLQSQARTIDKLHNVIRQRLKIYQQPETDANIDLVVKWLKNQGVIKQHNQSIDYPTTKVGSDTNKHQEKSSVKSATNKDSEAIVSTTQQASSQKNKMNDLYQKALQSLKSRSNNHRPAKKQTLENHLKSHLRVDDDTIKRLIQRLSSKKVIVISKENKLIYHI